jgi:hypothetical protein
MSRGKEGGKENADRHKAESGLADCFPSLRYNRHGKIILEQWSGYDNPHYIFRLFSQSKPITAAATLICVDDELFSLEDPIVKFIPEFRVRFLFFWTPPGCSGGSFHTSGRPSLPRSLPHALPSSLLPSFPPSQTLRVIVNATQGAAIETTPLRREITIRHLLTHTGASLLPLSFPPSLLPMEPVSALPLRVLILPPLQVALCTGTVEILSWTRCIVLPRFLTFGDRTWTVRREGGRDGGREGRGRGTGGGAEGRRKRKEVALKLFWGEKGGSR